MQTGITYAEHPTMTMTTAEKKKSADTGRVLEAKWGKAAIASGFTAIPDVVFQNQKALKLKSFDVLVILHLASYWWKPDGNPRPAKGTIADALDVDPRTVQRSIQKMEAMGYIRRIYRTAKVGDNLPNEYDLAGLVKHVNQLAEEKLALKAKRAAEDKSKLTTPAAFALIAGGKES